MFKLAPYLIGGLVTLAVMDRVPLPAATANHDSSATTTAERAVTVIDRSQKGDRLAMTRHASGSASIIAAVELVGLRDTAIVYRDRDGKILFQTDPISNTTVVAEDVALPEVTVRESHRVFVTTVPIVAPGQTARGSTPPVETPSRHLARAPKLPIGCDPAFSPLASSASLNFAGRCLS
ncbi:MAG: hypothetical protein ACLPKB_29295 [Xanthobacteraceae bacterium]